MDETGTEKVNILLVDDRPDKLLALEAVIESLHQNVVKATSGKEALRCLLQQDFAVILLDVNMPGMDGFETASLIRQRKQSEHTPIIFVTAFNDDTHVAKGYSLGAVDYISAPIDPDEPRVPGHLLVVRINERIDRARADAVQKAWHLYDIYRAVPAHAVCDRHAISIGVADLRQVPAHTHPRS